MILATGHSQSALLLTAYYNAIQPTTGIIDGFIIRGGGDKLRTDVTAKVIRINAESDLVLLGMAGNRQPHTDRMVTWEITCTSHADKEFLDYYGAISKRDFGSFSPLECTMPLCSLIPFNYAYSAILEHLVRWIKENIQPPAGIPITLKQTDTDIFIARDSLNNALGGIRLPQFDVPVAMNTGINRGDGFCM